MSEAREAILSRIREALQDGPAGDPPARAQEASPSHRSSQAERAEIMARFRERIADYQVQVRLVEEGHLGQAIATICAERHLQRLAMPADLPEAWRPAGIEVYSDHPWLSYEQLDHCDGVLTGCALGIAQTGTIVLDGGAKQGRRVLTLLPDYHLCLIYERQIVDLVPEAIQSLHPAVMDGRPITFISGPSATSDIEFRRVEGVHGPRTLEVLIVKTPENA